MRLFIYLSHFIVADLSEDSSFLGNFHGDSSSFPELELINILPN